jgi:two-component system NtrC family sensor kinase
MTITRKFTLLLLVGILMAQAASAAIRIRRELALVQREVVNHELSLARVLSGVVVRTWTAHGERAALDLLAKESHDTEFIVRWVWPSDGKTNEHSPRASAEELSSLAPGAPLVVRSDGDNVLYTYLPVRTPDGRLGAIEIGESLKVEYAYMEKTVTAVTLTALALAVLTTLFAWALGARLIGRPMRILVEQARRVGAGDFATRLRPEGGDELGQLGREMDRMCDGLEIAAARVQSETQARFAALEQLRHADRLTTVGTLASGVAHELGTPLNVIDGHAQLIREDASATDEQKQHANVISRQCKRMTAIIRQLLDFARRGRTYDGPCDVRGVVRDTLKMVEPLARARRVEIEIEPGEDKVWARLGVEPMQQVLANLMLNGVHAMPDGGTLSVRVAREADGDGSDGTVRIDVKDTGEGMDETTMQRVFEPFFTTKDVGQGTGLGLSVAHGIVSDSGGRIEVTSEVGAGSCFSVLVPEGAP